MADLSVNPERDVSTPLFWLVFQHILIFEHTEKTFEQSGAHKNDTNCSTF